jgi:hypothetical protein
VRRRRWLIPIALGILASCSSSPKTPSPEPADLPEQTPGDFALSVTVYSPASEPGQIDALPRSLRPARYIVEADGLLRAAIGPGATSTTFPPGSRRLEQRQIDRLWVLIRRSPFLDKGFPGRIPSEDTYRPRRDRTTAVVGVTWLNRQGSFRVVLDRSDNDALLAERLADELSELAWQTD